MPTLRVTFNKSELKEFGGEYDGPTLARQHVETTKGGTVTEVAVAEQQFDPRRELTYDVTYDV